MGVLESERVGRARDQMQLAYLYVSRAYRGRGVGTKLFEAVLPFAREAGARALYVSAQTHREYGGLLPQSRLHARP